MHRDLWPWHGLPCMDKFSAGVETHWLMSRASNSFLTSFLIPTQYLLLQMVLYCSTTQVQSWKLLQGFCESLVAFTFGDFEFFPYVSGYIYWCSCSMRQTWSTLSSGSRRGQRHPWPDDRYLSRVMFASKKTFHDHQRPWWFSTPESWTPFFLALRTLELVINRWIRSDSCTYLRVVCALVLCAYWVISTCANVMIMRNCSCSRSFVAVVAKVLYVAEPTGASSWPNDAILNLRISALPSTGWDFGILNKESSGSQPSRPSVMWSLNSS